MYRNVCPTLSMYLQYWLSECVKADHMQLLCIGPVPPSWGEGTAFPALQQLWLDSNQLTGSLPGSWPATLQVLNVTANKFTGRLPANMALQQQLKWVNMYQNNMTGALPAEWGSPGSFPQLWNLDCSGQHISGTLPSTWGSPYALQQLAFLYLDDSAISGTLPESWASVGAFPELIELEIDNSLLTGTLPVSWGSPAAFPNLQALGLYATKLHGRVPSFNNSLLAAIMLHSCFFSSDLGLFWSSSAPLLLAKMSNNSLSGSLPEAPDALSQLAFLDLNGNQLQGTVPLSWLHTGRLFSPVSFVNLGSVWQASISLTAWRQQLCLKQIRMM